MFNYFEIGCDCEQSVFPALPEDIDCSYTPRDSQIVGLVMLPLGASLPTDWTSAEAFLSAIDNTETAGRKGKYFIGMGDVPESADIIVPLGRGHQHIAGRVWTLNFAPGMATSGQYDFLRTIQQQQRKFRFWFATMGGRLLGGPSGIRPTFVTAKTAYAGGREDLEAAKIVINWRACVEPDRADVPGLFNVDVPARSVTDFVSAMANLRVISQAFIGVTSNVLTFTENGGAIPIGALIGVYQNGQRMLESQFVQAGSVFTISTDSYFEGDNFEIVIIILE